MTVCYIVTYIVFIMEIFVTSPRANWQLTAKEVAHAMPVLQSVHRDLRDLPGPGLPTIRHLAQRSNIRDGTLRTALSRACATGGLEVADGRYRLGRLSLEDTAAAQGLLTRTRGYTLAVVLEGEAADLPGLHDIFTRFGFRPLQRSVWVGARTTEDGLSPALQRAGLESAAVVFKADEVDAKARERLSRLWSLSQRTAELQSFHGQLIEHLTEQGISAREAAWRCVEAAPIWYRVAVQNEPPFPLELCGSDYPLERLNSAWRTHLASMTRQLIALWNAEEP